MVAFVGLLALHTIEILAFAAVYRALQGWGVGGFDGSYDPCWSGLIYFSGVNFATLGYTQIEATGPIRMVNMMQSLGGFMVLTWSATFLKLGLRTGLARVAADDHGECQFASDTLSWYRRSRSGHVLLM